MMTLDPVRRRRQLDRVGALLVDMGREAGPVPDGCCGAPDGSGSIPTIEMRPA